MSKFIEVTPKYGSRNVIINIEQISTIFSYEENGETFYRLNMANRDVYEDIREDEFNCKIRPFVKAG